MVDVEHELQSIVKYAHDVIVVGAGGAGLRAGIAAAESGVRVAVVCKSLLGKAHTVMAEGGAAAALGAADPRDNWKIHFKDTMKGGKYHGSWKMAEIHAKESPREIIQLEKWGAVFDRTTDGKINQRHFGGHTYQRLAHVGDRTGLEMIRTLQDKAVHMKNVEVFMEYTVIRILTDGNKVAGVFAYKRDTGDLVQFQAKAVVFATGGVGKAYTITSNSWEYTGDGHSLAFLAGADLVDMEFVQFHPTGMVYPSSVKGVLVTEGVRGEGGKLKNSEADRFMFNYIPEMFKGDYADSEEEADRWLAGDDTARKPPELLTRDIVAKAILAEVKAGRGSTHGGAYLDIASVRSSEYIKAKLPSMYHQFKTLAGLDITKDPMEVGPTTHYIMGGILVDFKTQETTLSGLFAAGECAGGLHGANRLGGNSLSDLLVFGRLAGESAAKYALELPHLPTISKTHLRDYLEYLLAPFEEGKTEDPFDLHAELKLIMDEYVGIIRTEDGIQLGIQKLEELRKRVKNAAAKGTRKYNPGWHQVIDLDNMILSGLLLAKAALARKESRGAHTRDDFPSSNENLAKIIYILRKDLGDEIELVEETLPPIPEDLRTLIREKK
ncbi:MAG: fumarate reductase/succinate dehydrogenase flavoprotein subunit [Candidatus Kariarchaeaceae archaeon]|jgi:succinate dehydrogenase / fumarate reductase flavoprotein subunit